LCVDIANIIIKTYNHALVIICSPYTSWNGGHFGNLSPAAGTQGNPAL